MKNSASFEPQPPFKKGGLGGFLAGPWSEGYPIPYFAEYPLLLALLRASASPDQIFAILFGLDKTKA
jgi:hypothetical protein